jgi:hypothetical protein
LIAIGIADIISMLKKGLKKEALPYSALLLLAAAVGVLALRRPFNKGIVDFLLDLFGIER